MEWIRRRKRLLQLVSALSALVLAALIAAFRGRPTAAEPWQIGVVVFPLVVGVASFLPLIYLSWFGKPRPPSIRALALAFFWLLVVVWVVIIVQLYGAFVFRLWG